MTEFEGILLKEKSHWYRILNKTKVINHSNSLAFFDKNFAMFRKLSSVTLCKLTTNQIFLVLSEIKKIFFKMSSFNIDIENGGKQPN